MNIVNYNNLTIEEIKDLIMEQFIKREIEGTKSDIYRLLVNEVRGIIGEIKIKDHRFMVDCNTGDAYKTRCIDISCYNRHKLYNICSLRFTVECKQVSKALRYRNATFKVKFIEFKRDYNYNDIKDLTIEEVVNRKVDIANKRYEDDLNKIINKENLNQLREKFNNVLDMMNRKEELTYSDTYDLKAIFGKYEDALKRYNRYIKE